jgi:hypothetical protein
MLHLPSSRWFSWVLALAFGLWAVAAQAHEFRYRYVPLDQVELPPGFIFFEAIAINNSGRVYGNAYECSNAACDSILPHIAVYANGAVTVLQPGFVHTANERGIIGGSVLIDPMNSIEQAALFHGDQVELIPPQPGEVTSFVIALNDRGTALVRSDDALGQPTYALYHNGQTTPLGFGPNVTRPFATGMNNQGTISGTDPFIGGSRGFRFDPRTGETTVLNPLPGESYAWGLGINNRGDVIGYSFVDFGLREEIGVWDHEREFKTYFVEGIPEFPTLSSSLLFNDNNLIVITFTTDNKSYLVPKPGVRLNLAELVENLPLGGNLSFIQDINNGGDMIGFDFGGGIFLLKRIGATGLQSSATTDGTKQSPSGVKNRGHDIPMAAATTLRAMLRRHLPPLKSGTAPLLYDPLESLLLK